MGEGKKKGERQERREKERIARYHREGIMFLSLRRGNLYVRYVPPVGFTL